jgi:hypothetical protein
VNPPFGPGAFGYQCSKHGQSLGMSEPGCPVCRRGDTPEEFHRHCIASGGHIPYNDHDSCSLCGLSGEAIAAIRATLEPTPDAFEVSMQLRCHSDDGLGGRPPPSNDPMPTTPAGRLAFVMDLASPHDDEGTPLEPLISSEDALKLLDFPNLEAFAKTREGQESLFGLDRTAEPHRFSKDFVAPDPDAERLTELARALFETDHEVRQFVHARAESYGWDGVGAWEEFDAARRARYAAAMRTAWERDELGARTRWMQRAKAVLDAM